MKRKIIIFIDKIRMGIGHINQVARMWPIKMQQDDLFMILSWRRENIVNRHWIIGISVAFSVFPPERELKYNVRGEEQRSEVSKITSNRVLSQWIRKMDVLSYHLQDVQQ